ncbi:hypothetical protein BP00DRAFT_277278 [Aspergillus indologenus CBS 114.80]|uniref:Uncharacterized protein n=1 Tax=Aspergillus indologenus CBS 114.80 TaxID=1450541 RepID=A0A2V5IV71_9EURO|nr:hypothetical protein BP00DRAFT_277278 [Aspergillus indologenus CBS 114.80]
MDGARWMGSEGLSVKLSVCLFVVFSSSDFPTSSLFCLPVISIVLSLFSFSFPLSFLTHSLSSSHLTAFASAVRILVLPYCFPLAWIEYRRVLSSPCFSKPLIDPMHN